MAHQLLVADAPAGPPPLRSAGRWDRSRLTLLVCWSALFAGVLLLGEHEVPLSRLDAAVTSGAVSEVRLSPGLPAGAQGSVLQTASWREGFHRYVATVRVARGVGRPSDRSSPVLRRDLGVRVRALSPRDVQLLPSSETHPGTAVLGRQVPDWVNGLRLALYLATLLLLGYGPSPWRASRWAWFWLMSLFGLQTLGVLAFLVLSGPTPLVARPRPSGRRLGGGAAFVVALLCAGLGSAP